VDGMNNKIYEFRENEGLMRGQNSFLKAKMKKVLGGKKPLISIILTKMVKIH